jgi:hypothetical protein
VNAERATQTQTVQRILRLSQENVAQAIARLQQRSSQ